MDEPPVTSPSEPSSPRGDALLVGLHLVAVVLAASSGYLARWSFHASTQPEADATALELLVLVAVAGGLLSLALQVATLLVPSVATRGARLLAHSIGVVASAVPTALIALAGLLTMGSLLPQAGDAMSLLTSLVLLACLAGSGYLSIARSQRRRAMLLLAAGSALVVSFFSVWWFVNGLALAVNLLGLDPATSG
ncbi:MAG: hypothetical protein ACTIMA_15795 [Brachybacterium tyrofermentans]|uniref:Uncharacterized protein n=1 Tax=Brachybacterium tyrofermentans TaxID=47848 RepID=A0ABW0FF71_9MICO|nr:hypothetical protein [Brachybacterium tyrofermentans]